MNRNIKAASVVVHRDGEGEQIALPGFPISNSKHNMGGTEKQGPITSLLPSGAERAVSLSRLADMTGLSTREVRRAIQRERLHGAPICSDNQHGYYLAASEVERAAFCRSMRGRALQILRAARAVEKGAAQIE